MDGRSSPRWFDRRFRCCFRFFRVCDNLNLKQVLQKKVRRLVIPYESTMSKSNEIEKTPSNTKKINLPSSSSKMRNNCRQQQQFRGKQLFNVVVELVQDYGGEVSIDIVASHAGYKDSNDSTFQNEISKLSHFVCFKHHKFIHQPQTILKLTSAGEDEAFFHSRHETNEEYQEEIKDVLKDKKMIQVFELIQDGEPHRLAEIPSKLGLKSQNRFLKLLDRINEKHHYLNYNIDKNTIQLSDICFPAGR